MRVKPEHIWFAGATTLFAALAVFVFWGTWSIDVVPVMPDCVSTPPADNTLRFVAGWLSDGRFHPSDIVNFIGPGYFWVELKYVIAAYFSMLGMVYFCRGRGLSRLASYSAGLLLAFSGYWFSLFSAGHLGWFHWMTYGIFAFGLVDRALEKGRLRHWLLLGATLAWSCFHQPDIWLLFTLFTGVYFLFRLFCVGGDRRFYRRVSAGAGLSALVFALIVSPGVIMMVQSKSMREGQIRESAGMKDAAAPSRDARWIFVTNWSLPFDETREFLLPRGKGDTSCPFVLSIGRSRQSGVKPYTGALGRPAGAPSGNYRQHSLYMGMVSCLFALIGIVSAFFIRNGRREILFFAVAALLFWLLSLGRNFEMLYRCVFMLPIGDSIRCPVKWVHLAEFSVAALAAWGIERTFSFLRGISRGVLLPTLLLCAAVAAGAFDLARVNRLYCAPVDVGEARRGNMNSSFAVLHRGDFSKPEVRKMVQERKMLSVANYLGHPDYFLVQVLSPHGKTSFKPRALPLTLGIVSLLTTLAVAAVSLKKT